MERTRSSSTSEELAEDDKKEKKDKKHATAFSFVSSFYDTHEYFVVRGQKRQGLIVDPGAASGLIGSETLRELLNNCVEPDTLHTRWRSRRTRLRQSVEFLACLTGLWAR